MFKKTSDDMHIARGLTLIDRFDNVDMFVKYWRACGSWPLDGPGVERLANWHVV